MGYRAITSIASLAFAFFYSYSLGVQNRSIVAFVMTANALTWIVITSGTTLTLRKLKPDPLENKLLDSFFSLYALEVLFSCILFYILVKSYSLFKNLIPLNLFLGIFLYFFLSGLHLLVVEILLAFDQFKASGLLDILSIILQWIFFLTLSHLNLLSVANTLFLAFSISYLIIFLIVIRYLGSKLTLTVGFGRPGYFYSLTKDHHSLGLSIGIMDRIDRVLIGFLLPTSTLGRYSVMSGMLSILRFIPDSISKLVVSKNILISDFFRKYWLRLTLLLCIAVAALSVISNKFIEIVLGEEWLLPIYVTFLYLFQELLRSVFQIQANKRIVQGFTNLVHRQAIVVPLFSVILTICLVPFLGIYGISSAISISFILSLLFLHKVKTK